MKRGRQRKVADGPLISSTTRAGITGTLYFCKKKLPTNIASIPDE
jgi:hypothetical protein